MLNPVKVHGHNNVFPYTNVYTETVDCNNYPCNLLFLVGTIFITTSQSTQLVTMYMAVPDRNRILFHPVFQAHHRVCCTSVLSFR